MKRQNMGFTLIELLVVVLIIGILASIALPQYQKAVAKSRFAEAITNLNSIAQAHQVCFLGKGEGCTFEDLSIEIGEPGGPNQGGRATQHFWYNAWTSDAAGGVPIWAAVQYRDEDVCLCYLQTGEIILSQDHDEAGCVAKAPSFDYAKLLHVRDVGYTGCGCC